MAIARVFPRKTRMSPDDELAFFDVPSMFDIIKCQNAGVTEVHISVTFTYDMEKAEHLYYAWEALGVPVEVGGPAFNDRMGDFVPGMYVKQGNIFPAEDVRKTAGFVLSLGAVMESSESCRLWMAII